MDQPRLWRTRSSRRGFLFAGAATGLLVACSSSNNNNSAPTKAATNVASATSGAATSTGSGATAAASTATPAATPAAIASQTATTAALAVKKGGTWNASQGQDVPALDPYATNSSAVKNATSYAYSRLFVIQPTAPDKNGVIQQKVVPDVAASYEASGDGLTYTIKLKPNVKFHPPLSRQLTADDVVFSFQRFTGQLPGGKPSPTYSPLTMVDSAQAVDPTTVVFKLNRPYGPFINILADGNDLLLMPKETGTAFDPAKTMVGSNAWIFEQYQPGTMLSFKRNPDWHGGPDMPYLDRLVFNIVKDYATALNQFQAGNLDTLGINGLDVGDVKKRIPTVQLVVRDSGLAGYTSFSQVMTPRQGAPWTDPRVRQALSMAMNRDEIIDAVYNLSKIKAQGFDLPGAWSSLLPRSFGSTAFDPTTDPNLAKYYKFDANAAKAMISAAGGNFSANLHYSQALGPEYVSITELLAKYWSDIGVTVNLVQEDYASVYTVRTLRGDFDGLAQAGYAGISLADSFLRASLSKDSQTNQSKVNDPKVESAFTAFENERDEAKRNAILVDLQRYLHPQMYYIPMQWGAVPAITAYQPNVHGAPDHQSFGYGSGGVESPYFWKA